MVDDKSHLGLPVFSGLKKNGKFARSIPPYRGLTRERQKKLRDYAHSNATVKMGNFKPNISLTEMRYSII